MTIFYITFLRIWTDRIPGLIRFDRQGRLIALDKFRLFGQSFDLSLPYFGQGSQKDLDKKVITVDSNGRKRNTTLCMLACQFAAKKL